VVESQSSSSSVWVLVSVCELVLVVVSECESVVESQSSVVEDGGVDTVVESQSSVVEDGGTDTVVESQSSVVADEDEVSVSVSVVVSEVLLVLVGLLDVEVSVEDSDVAVQSVAGRMAQLVAQPRPLHFSWQGKFKTDVAGGVGQPQFCVTVLRTRQAGTGQLWHCVPVAVMVGQGPGGVVWWLSVAATGAMLCKGGQYAVRKRHQHDTLTRQPRRQGGVQASAS
jgi:hypothetical protein